MLCIIKWDGCVGPWVSAIQEESLYFQFVGTLLKGGAPILTSNDTHFLAGSRTLMLYHGILCFRICDKTSKIILKAYLLFILYCMTKKD